jgi:murein tripeptide amidase MpaA
MYIASYFIENSNEDRVKNILEKVTIIIVPFVNPDGYEYTWTGDRLWRKNRQINSGSTCRGVDLNRNYNDHWNEGGSSSNPCSETYHGPGSASEPETQNTQNYFKANAPIIAAIDWHSYSQLILRPYGWTNASAPNEGRMKSIGDTMGNLMYEINGARYTSQKFGLYPATGSAGDWFYGDEATFSNRGYRAASYTIQLRDTGQFGFFLPQDQIILTGEEVIPAILYLAESYSKHPIVH